MTAVIAFLTGPLGRWLAIALLVLSAAGFGAAKMHAHDQKKLDALTAEHNRFVGGVAAVGEAARQRAARQAETDRKAKERADEENRLARTRERAALERLRALATERDSRGGSMSAAPAGSRCPDGLVCFDRAEYQRALGDFDREARRLADEGTSLGIDLETAARWVQKR